MYLGHQTRVIIPVQAGRDVSDLSAAGWLDNMQVLSPLILSSVLCPYLPASFALPDTSSHFTNTHTHTTPKHV